MLTVTLAGTLPEISKGVMVTTGEGLAYRLLGF